MSEREREIERERGGGGGGGRERERERERALITVSETALPLGDPEHSSWVIFTAPEVFPLSHTARWSPALSLAAAIVQCDLDTTVQSKTQGKSWG